MKRNRIAAGALALALGLGAVAPAVAAEDKDPIGAQHFLTRYNKELEATNALYKAYLKAESLKDAKAEKLAEAKAELEAAIARLDAVAGKKSVITEIHRIIETEKDKVESEVLEEKVVEVFVREKNRHEELARNAYNKIRELSDKVSYSYEHYMKEDGRTAEQLRNDARGSWVSNKTNPTEDDLQELYDAIDTFVNEREEVRGLYAKKADIRDLVKDVKAKVLARDVAQNEYNDAYNAYVAAKEAYDNSLAALEKSAKGYNATVQVENDGIKIVNKDDEKVKPIEKEEVSVKRLEASIKRAEIAIEAVKLLQRTAPDVIAPHKAELDKLVADQEANLAKAEKALKFLEGRKVSLISTAYAAEEDEVKSEEDVLDIINNLDDTSEKTEKKLEEINSGVKKENEAVKEEDNKEEDKKDDKKEEEKPAEKEDKKEDKKEESKPAKKAGSNAKTGIAGVAGVAGILAAASVAYAASKRD